MEALHRVFLHTGSNIGDRLKNLAAALITIEQNLGQLEKVSSIYETEAWGIKDQSDFLNQAVEIQTRLSPEELLKAIKKIEKQMGRLDNKKWGPRLIDIDILFYETRIILTPRLNIPHLRIEERKFVLAPLAEIAPDFVHPILNINIQQLLLETKDELKVKKVDKIKTAAHAK